MPDPVRRPWPDGAPPFLDMDKPTDARGEENYWEQVGRTREAQDQDLVEEYERETRDLRIQLVELLAKRTRLAEALQQVRGDCDKTQAQINAYDQRLSEKKALLTADREQQDEQWRAWFAQVSRRDSK